MSSRQEVISNSFTFPRMQVLRGACCRSKEDERFREGTLPVKGHYKKSACWLQSFNHPFPRGIAGVQLCLEGRFDRTCVMDSVKHFQ